MKVVFFHRKPRQNANFSVEILFKEIREALPKEVDWSIRTLRYYSNGFIKRLLIGLEAAFNQADVNHITGDVNFIAIFLKKKKTVLTILDLGLMNHPNRLARLILKWFWVTLPVRRSTVITTISQATKTELLQYAHVNPDKIKVVYVPIAGHFKPYPKQFEESNPVILQVGTKANKNVKRLVKALKGIPCKLEIIGEVNDELKKELAVAGVGYNHSRNLTNEQVLEKYRDADILAFVSTYEGFGMPIIEANAIGRVVITSNVLSMPEVAGDAAHLVDPFDVESIRAGILKVIQDRDYREQLITNGFRNRSRFDVHEIANQYTEIYRDIVNGVHV